MDEFILGLLGPTHFNLIARSLRTLQAYGVNDVYPVIEATISDDTHLDNTGRRMAIFSIVRENLNELILRQGVTVAEDAPLEIFELVARTLKEASEEYDPDHILNHVNVEVSDEQPALDTFLKLVELLHDKEPMELVEVINYVDDHMIATLRRILDEKVIPEIQTKDPARKERYLTFLKGKRTGVVFGLLEAGMSIGQFEAMDLAPYIDEGVEGMDDTSTAFELASLLLISSTEISKSVVDTLVSLFREDEQKIMALRVRVNKLLGELS